MTFSNMGFDWSASLLKQTSGVFLLTLALVVPARADVTPTKTLTLPGDMSSMVVNNVTGTAYIATPANNDILMFNVVTNEPKGAIPAGDCPKFNSPNYNFLGVDENDNKIYFLCSTTAKLYAIDGRTNAVLPNPVKVAVSGFVQGLVVNKMTNKAYVLTYRNPSDNGHVHVVDLDTSTNVATVEVGREPIALAVNEKTNRIYVSNRSDATVSVIDGVSNAVTATVTVMAVPHGIVANAQSNKIYVATQKDGGVSVIDGGTNAVGAVMLPQEGGKPNLIGIGANPISNMIYVTSYGSRDDPDNKLYAINGYSNQVQSTITVGDNPSTVEVDEVTGTVYVYNAAGDTISVLEQTCVALESAQGAANVARPTGAGSSAKAPPVPTLDGVIFGADGIQVAFSDPSAPEGTRFTVFAKSISSNQCYQVSGSSSPFTLRGLALDDIYDVAVKAENTDGIASGYSAIKKAALAKVDVLSVVTRNSSATVTFSYSNPSDSPVSSFQVVPTQGAPWTGNASPIALTLKNGVTYQVQVNATNAYGVGRSDLSDAFTVGDTPLAPTITALNPGNRFVDVVFSAPDNRGFPITGYTVVANYADSGNSHQTTRTVQASPARMDNLINGTPYGFTVRAANARGTGDMSLPAGPVIPSPPPAAPTITRIEPEGSSAAVFYQGPTSNVPAPIAGYKVVAEPGGITASGMRNPLVLNGLTVGQRYSVSLVASNYGGDSQPAQADFSAVSLLEPPVIADVAARNGSADVSFTHPQTGYQQNITYGVVAYEYNRIGWLEGWFEIPVQVSGVSSSLIVTGGLPWGKVTATKSLTVTGLPWGKNLRVQVTATNAALNQQATSAYSKPFMLDPGSWMGSIPDNRLLTQLLIPGTHDSAAIALTAELGETQDWDIATQLGNGIRFLDVRVSNQNKDICGPQKLFNVSNKYELRHGPLCLGDLDTVVMGPVTKFLKANPKETVLMSISDEGTLNTVDFVKDVLNRLDWNNNNLFVTSATTATTLGSVRGRIVLFDRLCIDSAGGKVAPKECGTSGAVLPLNWKSQAMKIQDEYDLDNNCDWTWKWDFWDGVDCSLDYPKKARSVVAHLNDASSGTGANYWINFASANWNGMYIGNSAEVSNAAVRDYFNALMMTAKDGSVHRFGSIVVMDYPNRHGNGVIPAMLNYNRLSQ
jgi:YVTN family beta-propeller protein